MGPRTATVRGPTPLVPLAFDLATSRSLSTERVPRPSPGPPSDAHGPGVHRLARQHGARRRCSSPAAASGTVNVKINLALGPADDPDITPSAHRPRLTRTGSTPSGHRAKPTNGAVTASVSARGTAISSPILVLPCSSRPGASRTSASRSATLPVVARKPNPRDWPECEPGRAGVGWADRCRFVTGQTSLLMAVGRSRADRPRERGPPTDCPADSRAFVCRPVPYRVCGA